MAKGLNDLNDYLFESLERLNSVDLGDSEKLQQEIARAETVTKISAQVIANANTQIKAVKELNDYGYVKAEGVSKKMVQLMPMKIDKVGAASVLSSKGERFEMADNTQVYLWYKGQYYPTKLAQVDADGYQLTGWYDNFGCAAGKKVRVIIAVKND